MDTLLVAATFSLLLILERLQLRSPFMLYKTKQIRPSLITVSTYSWAELLSFQVIEKNEPEKEAAPTSFHPLSSYPLFSLEEICDSRIRGQIRRRRSMLG